MSAREEALLRARVERELEELGIAPDPGRRETRPPGSGERWPSFRKYEGEH